MHEEAPAVAENIFWLDSNLTPIEPMYNAESVYYIMQAVSDHRYDFSELRNKRLYTVGRIYYISAAMIPSTEGTGYRVVYVDVTGYLNLASMINRNMFMSLFAMFVGAVIITFFLSNSITSPIKKLVMFATNIGRGDFSPNDFMFKDIELIELNTALSKSARQLNTYDIEHKAFFQNASHELRTPLMSIKAYTEGIQFGIMNPQTACETILQETDRLSDMVTDLLYVSKIDNITTVFKSAYVDLAELLRASAIRLRPVADKRNIIFTFYFDDNPIIYYCVSELMSRAFDNLISNALRYASTEINLTCRRVPGYIEIIFKDDGIGISEEVLPHVFERFYKGPDGNFGIGLAIVKSIMEQHGSQIKAENSPEGGAVFTMTLYS